MTKESADDRSRYQTRKSVRIRSQVKIGHTRVQVQIAACIIASALWRYDEEAGPEWQTPPSEFTIPPDPHHLQTPSTHPFGLLATEFGIEGLPLRPPFLTLDFPGLNHIHFERLPDQLRQPLESVFQVLDVLLLTLKVVHKASIPIKVESVKLLLEFLVLQAKPRHLLLEVLVLQGKLPDFLSLAPVDDSSNALPHSCRIPLPPCPLVLLHAVFKMKIFVFERREELFVILVQCVSPLVPRDFRDPLDIQEPQVELHLFESEVARKVSAETQTVASLTRSGGC
jgi:hypothetical protein